MRLIDAEQQEEILEELENICISNEYILELLAKLKNQPTVEDRPSGEWIPVSERLPRSCGVYIVTREVDDGFACADLTDACYFDGTGTWHDDNRINHSREYVDKKIKAWMELPVPYKEGEAQ